MFAFARFFDLGGNSAKLGLLLPYTGLNASGFVKGEYRERQVSGFADPGFVLSVNLGGAPALRLDEFRHYRKKSLSALRKRSPHPPGNTIPADY